MAVSAISCQTPECECALFFVLYNSYCPLGHGYSLEQAPNASMPFKAGHEETGFLESLGISVADIEFRADNCSKVRKLPKYVHWSFLNMLYTAISEFSIPSCLDFSVLESGERTCD